jgi:glycosyltransferase involved in cell wall biosynthesis
MMAQKDSRVIGLRLSRNFGQHNAITAGIDLARGHWLVVMDCDLQDSPEEIPRLWIKAQEGHDVVIGRRVERQDGFFKRLFSRIFHWIFRYVTDQQSDSTQSNFGIYSRKVVDKVKTLSEHLRIFPLLVRWSGFEVISIDVEHNRRDEGKSGYSFSRKILLAMDIIFSYSGNPLKMCARFTFYTASATICLCLWFFIYCFIFGYTTAGWVSLLILLFFVIGIFIIVMGILGTYIGRIFYQEKARPLYVVQDRTQMT